MCSICEPGKDPQAARVCFHGRMAKPQLVKLCQSAQAPGALLQPSLRISQPGSSCPAWPCSPEPAASRSVPITGRWKWGTAPRTPPCPHHPCTAQGPMDLDLSFLCFYYISPRGDIAHGVKKNNKIAEGISLPTNFGAELQRRIACG